jgi:transcription factor TFIIIB component B''
MSSYGSSLINKSGRKVIPKAAPPRRRLPQPTIQKKPVPTVTPTAAPVATTNEDLEAQTQIREEEIIASASKPIHDEIAEELEDSAVELYRQPESRYSPAVVDNSAQAQADDADHRPKRRRLNKIQMTTGLRESSTSKSPTPEQPAPTTIQSPESITPSLVPSTSRIALKRAARTFQNTLRSPPVAPNPRALRIRTEISSAQQKGGSVPALDTTVTGTPEVEQEEEITHGSTWVITTQEQIRKKTSIARDRHGTRATVKGRYAPVRSIENPITDVLGASTARSARIANIEKRKRKKGALDKATTFPLAKEISQQEGEDEVDDDADFGGDDSPCAADDDICNDEHETENEKDNSRKSKKSRKTRQRAETPDESETVTIVPSVVTMFELAARDRRTGMKSERERKMKLIDWDLVKARREEEERRLANERGRRRNATTPNPEEYDEDDNIENEEDLDAALSRVAARNQAKRKQGIRIRVVNGEHVIDEQSQRVDRHALANEDLDALEEVEEEELTQQFNSHTYVHLKRRDPAERVPSKDRWDTGSTEKFYECLARFGTDFMIISKMFPGRTRRQIKAKFVREERANLARIQDALKGEQESERLPWDLEVFRMGAGLELSEFKDPREVEAELSAIRREREKDIEEQQKETEEIQRQRKLAGDVSEGEENENAATADTKGNNESKRSLLDDELEEIEELSD